MSKLRVLIACEFSGIVREAFARRGHNAWSCDLLPSEKPWHHHLGDVRDLLPGTISGDYRVREQPWDLIIAHPPCTYLSVSGARWWKNRFSEQQEAMSFFMMFVTYKKFNPSLKLAIENPIGIMSSHFRKPDQIIQPWMFGHGETKATCLWLYNLPKLTPTNVVEGREQRIHKMPPSPDRGKERSRTFQGIADAMAEQWGELA
jgi:site-specific DNA-cytosine methylase